MSKGQVRGYVGECENGKQIYVTLLQRLVKEHDALALVCSFIKGASCVDKR